jgi:peptidoglycan/xylan/chitin deacetylase (PgdA/CDA1 family)
MSSGRSLVLVYHNIVPDEVEEVGERTLHLPLGSFVEQLDILSATCDILPLDSLIHEAPNRSGRRPKVSITFDDAYRGAVELGVGELSRRGLPATIFVSPGLLGGRAFWWDEFADQDSRTLSEEFRNRALDECRGEDSAIRRWARRLGHEENAVGVYAKSASINELGAAVGGGCISLASHTWSHPNLTRLDASELQAELEKPLQWLDAHFESVIPYLSYPYGLSNPRVQKAAATAGCRAAFLIEGGRIPRKTGNRYALPRVNVGSGLSRNGFVLRVAGITS